MAMFVIRFDRIFDVKHGVRSHKEVTYFGFESGSIKQNCAVVPGKPELNEGDLVTVFLRDPKDWQTLLGGANHSTGELVVESHDYESSTILLGSAAVLFGLGRSGLHPTVYTILFFSLAFWIGSAALKKSELRRVRKELEEALRRVPQSISISKRAPVGA